MTTIINTPRADDNSGMGFLAGIVFVIAIAVLFVVYGLPILRHNTAPQDKGINVNVTLPTNPDNNNSNPAPAQ